MNIINDVKTIWFNYGYNIIIICCIIFLFVLSIVRKITGKKGSWSNKYYHNLIPPKLGKNSKLKSNIMQGKDSKGEIECKKVMEEIFKKPFSKIRPKFLNNPVTGGYHNLELDCYNDQLKLAVEYNGRQHYEFVPFFHKNKESFMNQKYRDELKRRMCNDNNITLIEVPYTIKIEHIKKFLLNQLIKINLLKLV